MCSSPGCARRTATRRRAPPKCWPRAPRHRQSRTPAQRRQSTLHRHQPARRLRRPTRPLRKPLLRAWRDGKPDQRITTRSLRRPHQHSPPQFRPVAPVVLHSRLHSDKPPAPRPHPLRQRLPLPTPLPKSLATPPTLPLAPLSGAGAPSHGRTQRESGASRRDKNRGERGRCVPSTRKLLQNPLKSPELTKNESQSTYPGSCELCGLGQRP